MDSNLPDNFGRSVMYGLSATTTFISITIVGGFPFLFSIIIIGFLYFSGECVAAVLATLKLTSLDNYSWKGLWSDF